MFNEDLYNEAEYNGASFIETVIKHFQKAFQKIVSFISNMPHAQVDSSATEENTKRLNQDASILNSNKAKTNTDDSISIENKPVTNEDVTNTNKQ